MPERRQSESFDRFILDQVLTHFVDTATAHYQAIGSWSGVERAIAEAVASDRRPPPPKPSPAPPMPAGSRTGHVHPFALADQHGIVVVPAGQFSQGSPVDAAILKSGIAVTVDSQAVGTVIRTAVGQALSAPERRYVERTRLAILRAVGIGLLLAISLGLVLARGYSRPVRKLTVAARALAEGDPETRVEVGRRDEFGELAGAFNEMSAKLEAAAASRRRLTADIAHDLRTPLTVLTGYLEAMRDGDLTSSPERLATMHTEAMQLSRQVEDLHTLSLSEAGEMVLKVSAVRPCDLYERILAAMEQQAREKKIMLAVDAGADLPVIQADFDRMIQVLSNLVQNALRHTPEGGEITLSAVERGAHVILKVEDTGTGIPAAALPHIFERYYRVSASRLRKQGESGLGLTIARSFVEAQGGTIVAESEQGRGATFTIALPAGPA